MLIAGYRVSIQWSVEDQCFVVTVPDLPGCMAHGDSFEQAVEAAKEAISSYLETVQDIKHGS